MKNLKALTLAALTAVTAVTAPVAKADNFEGHNQLWQALENNGVDVSVNHPEHCKENWGGAMYATFKDGTTALFQERVGDFISDASHAHLCCEYA